MNILRKKPFGKLLSLLVTALFTVISSINVFAAEAQTIELKQNGEQAEIILTFPQAAKEEISSLQISLSADLGTGGTAAEFVPAAGLSAKIAEGRFNRETGILNIYIAGTSPLFSKENPVLSLGYVRVTGEDCYADVKVVKNSLKFVRGTELVVQDTGVEYPENTVRITSESEAETSQRPSYGGGSGDFVVPETTTSASEPVQTPASSSETKPVTTAETTLPVTTTAESAPPAGNTGVTAPSEDNAPAIPVEGESFSRAEKKALTEAVSRAELYKRSDYSESSYRSLREAVEKAKALLLEDDAKQEEVDEALLILENAIGMLVPSNAPSQVEENVTDVTEVGSDNGTNEETSASLPSESDTEAETQSTSDTTAPPSKSDEANSEQPSDTQAPTEDTGNGSEGNPGENPDENSDSLTPWIIVLAVLAAAIVVIAIAAVISSNKKKAKSGTHSKTSKK